MLVWSDKIWYAYLDYMLSLSYLSLLFCLKFSFFIYIQFYHDVLQSIISPKKGLREKTMKNVLDRFIKKSCLQLFLS